MAVFITFFTSSSFSRFITAEASGLIIASKDFQLFTPEIIEYCNRIHFPLFSASWNTSFLEILRQLSEILLSADQTSAVLTTALRNAIYYPTDYKSYVPHFERSNYFNNSYYTITIIEASKNLLQARESLLDNFKKHFLNSTSVLPICSSVSVLTRLDLKIYIYLIKMHLPHFKSAKTAPHLNLLFTKN